MHNANEVREVRATACTSRGSQLPLLCTMVVPLYIPTADLQRRAIPVGAVQRDADRGSPDGPAAGGGTPPAPPGLGSLWDTPL